MSEKAKAARARSDADTATETTRETATETPAAPAQAGETVDPAAKPTIDDAKLLGTPAQRAAQREQNATRDRDGFGTASTPARAVSGDLGRQSLSGGNQPAPAAPPAEPEPNRGLVGDTVKFVMPGHEAEPRIRNARVLRHGFRDRLTLSVATIPDVDGLPNPFTYPDIGHDEDKRPGTWHR